MLGFSGQPTLSSLDFIWTALYSLRITADDPTTVLRCTWRPGARAAYANAMGGVAGLFATNSDDLALGLPCFVALFGEEKAQLLYALCAAQSLTLNPALFILLGVGAADARPRRGGKSGIVFAYVHMRH